MKKLIILLTLAVFGKASFAQDTPVSKIIASDPTQTFTFIEPSAGINFLAGPGNVGPDSWLFNFNGQFGIKKFALEFSVPVTNVGNSYTLLGDIQLKAKYRFYYNPDNFLHASSLKAGLLIPTTYDGIGDVAIGFGNYGFFNYFFNYTAGLNVNEKLKIYPSIEVKKYQSVERGSYYFVDNDSLYVYPSITQLAFGAGLVISYDFNSKSFIQFEGAYEGGTWQAEDGSSITGYDDGKLSRRAYYFSLKYQYAFTNRSQAFIKVGNETREYFGNPFNTKIGANRVNLTLGYQYYLR